MADEQNPNALDMWRQYITDSERQWNGFFKDVLGTDAFANSMNSWVEASLTVQRMMADQLERLYTTFNIPSHSDLVSLGERMKAIEDALARLEGQVSVAAPAKPAPARVRPPRTKKPAANGATAKK